MPWCPRCDETFPQGPACPRCSTRLIAREEPEDPLEAVPDLRSIKVSRRNRRALERLSGPRVPSPRALVFAIVLLTFAAGFLLGRVGSFAPSGPTVRALPAVEPLAFEGVEGSSTYLLASTDGLTTITSHDLYSGDVEPLSRIDAPFDAADLETTEVVSLGRSVAVIVGDGEGSYVAFAPDEGAPHGWVPGVEAAWASPDELVVRRADGALQRWTSDGAELRSQSLGEADGIVQTSGGVARLVGRTLERDVGSQVRELELPVGAEALAVSGDHTRAVIADEEGAALWDGTERVPVQVEADDVVGASFERDGQRAAIVVRSGDDVMLAISDMRGDAAIKRLGGSASCEAVPAWDAAGRWVYVATGNGLLYAAETGGGRVEAVRTRGQGCGAAWLDTP